MSACTSEYGEPSVNVCVNNNVNEAQPFINCVRNLFFFPMGYYFLTLHPLMQCSAVAHISHCFTIAVIIETMLHILQFFKCLVTFD